MDQYPHQSEKLEKDLAAAVDSNDGAMEAHTKVVQAHPGAVDASYNRTHGLNLQFDLFHSLYKKCSSSGTVTTL